MKLYPATILFFAAIIISSCATAQPSVPKNFPSFYKEGHRGTRGLMPENTIPSMIAAIENGANMIEVDVYTSKDGQVFIAHDPFVNINHSLYADGKEIAAADARKFIFHQMNYAEIRQFDVGSKPYAAYPQQARVKTYMPLLGELIDSVEAYTKSKKLKPTIYNIELKTNPRFDSLGYNSGPEEMIDKVMVVVGTKNIGNRFYIQSFDFRPLIYVNKKYPQVTIGFLTSSKTLSLDDNLKQLGFAPDIYSPEYRLVTKEMVEDCKKQQMKLVPWTVNTAAEMKTLIDLGVNGIITDYPNLFAQFSID
jgi:glycerophosphoryl diester phosphodiesterase